MLSNVRFRSAISLPELIVCMAIIALMIGLLLPAIQKIRDAARTAKATNSIKQIALACHNYATVYDGTLPTVDGRPTYHVNPITGWKSTRLKPHLLDGLLPYMEPNAYRFNGRIRIEILMNAADPSDDYNPSPRVPHSGFGANACAFAPNGNGIARFENSFADGISNTIFYAERYSICGTVNLGSVSDPWHEPIRTSASNYLNMRTQRRASFAEGGPMLDGKNYGDVYPIVESDSRTRPSRAGATFQVLPRVLECDPTLVQATNRSGLLVAMGDGSTRIVNSNVAPEQFWSMVTPSAGDRSAD
jgi:type II secretory pathway pseudopilin PulG